MNRLLKQALGRGLGALCLCAVFGTALPPNSAAAENIKIGIVKTALSGPIFIAQDKGYFAAEGLSADIVFFDAAAPIAVAVAGGAIDIGSTGTSGALFNLAGQGVLRIVSGGAQDVSGFPLFAMVVSNPAWDAGLKSYATLANHSVITSVGSPTAYGLALIEEKYRLDPATIRLVPSEGIPAAVSTIIGARADAAPLPAIPVAGPVRDGKMKLLGYIGEETPWQVSVVFVTVKTANDRQEFVKRYLRAVGKGAREYRDAFIDPDGHRKDGPAAAEILPIMSKYLDQPVAAVAQNIAYVDGEGRLDVKDILHQLAWYHAQGLVKGEFDPTAIIDKRYVVPLPGH